MVPSLKKSRALSNKSHLDSCLSGSGDHWQLTPRALAACAQMPALICCSPATLGQSWEKPYSGFPPWGLRATFKIRGWYGMTVPTLTPGCPNLLAWFPSLATALAHHQNLSENRSTVRRPQLPPAVLSLLYLTPAPWGEKNQTCNKNQTALSWRKS